MLYTGSCPHCGRVVAVISDAIRKTWRADAIEKMVLAGLVVTRTEAEQTVLMGHDEECLTRREPRRR